ncbi:HupE/UreJ family protein [Rhodobacteraceae bacterium KN286]|uniref:HupE/UreJ family protein n=2 Tax=Oceanomicrobium pacificus TaxID=2692916 RepID=A0A6B0TIE2_9RHOB|nr:HupE/UreJ family protein [Oceanomicrobium pacificus]
MAAALLLWLSLAGGLSAHALEPGFLDIRETAPDQFLLIWKVPQVSGTPMEITARLPDSCTQPRPPQVSFAQSAFITSWQTDCPGGLTGQPITIEGLDATRTDVLVRLEPLTGARQTLRMTPGAASAAFAVEPSLGQVVQTYLYLGIDHILVGIDHLLFVLALVLLVPGRWALLKTVTAFTLAHSITLSLATLGFLTLPGPPVEAVIALSITFLATELLRLRRGEQVLSARKPWLVAFTFGLLHGLGFAGALAETGLPPSDIPAALLMFNIGVELGQILFIAVVLAVIWLVRRILDRMPEGARIAALGQLTVIYAIGGVSAYWLLERVAGFFA